MELRALEYFLAVAHEGSISGAAKSLHVTQPTLSRQLAALEAELGRQLYTRNYKGVELTEQGAILRTYAESIIDLATKAEETISLPSKTVSGTVHIGTGETQVMGLLARAMNLVREKYPLVDFKLYSGTSADLMDNLVKGFYDVLLECEVQHHVNLNVLRLPQVDTWGLLTRWDNPLANLSAIRPHHLKGQRVIVSRQGTKVGALKSWLGEVADELQVVAEYNLPVNTQYLVKEGVGSAILYAGLFATPSEGPLRFVPLEPTVESHQGIVWRKTLPTRQAQVFLDQLKALVEGQQ